jgi:hypothetical protein
MEFNPTISFYQGVKDTKGTSIDVLDALAIIGSDDLSNEIYTIVNTLGVKRRNALKMKLPAVTWSGRFSKRSANNLLQHSGLICLDFDKLENAREVKRSLILQSPAFMAAIFVSPSGNGLKVLCRVQVDTQEICSNVSGIQEMHTALFRQLAEFFKKVYKLEADESGKDVSRLCFLSWDTSIWIREDEPEPYVYEAEITTRKTKAITAKPESSEGEFERIRAFTDKKFTYTDGSRNQYINAFVMNCKHRGLSSEDVLHYCIKEFVDYVAEHGEKDVANIVKSVYGNSKIIADKYRKRETSQGNVAQAPKSTEPKTTQETEYNEKILFWYTVEKVDKETGEVKEEFKFDHDGITFFLANNGFRKVRLGEKGYQFVRTSNGLIEAVEPDDINHYIMKYLHKNVKAGPDGTYQIDDVMDDLYQVRKMYKRGINNYTKAANYSSLPELKLNFLKDNETTTFLYFENGYVEVNATEKKLHSYTELKANIWSKHRKSFKIKLLDNAEIENSVAWKFINLAILGSGSDDGKDPKRLLSMLTTIGYLIDTYKDPTNTKAPVFQDKKPNTGTDANGGSGKTLTAHMISKMVNSCLLDGKSFSFDSPYPYDTFRLDHKLIVYNDVNKRFPFENLFHKITEDFQFDRRYVDAIVIPHEESPKHLVITNYSLMGDTSSYRRRQHIIEFCDYFNDEYTPKDEFNHRFFIDWDEDEWNRFYNFMILCVQLYKKNGLVPFPAQNVKMNKLIFEAGEEFIDWMDEMFIGSKEQKPIRPLERNKKDELFEGFKNDVKRWSKLENSNKFTNWVKLWADMRGYHMQIDKSGRTYYWTFIEKTVK